MDLGSVKPNVSPPEVQDHWFWPDRARYLGRLDPSDYLALIDEIACDELDAVLGSALHRRGWKYAVDAGTGAASLGVLRAREVRLAANQYGGLQVRLDDVEPQAYIPVTDLRYFEQDQQTVRNDLVDDTNRRLRRGVEPYLMLGLARAFVAQGDEQERHWLQVNGICLSDDPYRP